MIDGVLGDLIIGLAICAVVLGIVAWFVHYHDPEVIDEEEEAAVERETPEERQAALARDAQVLSERPQDDLTGLL